MTEKTFWGALSGAVVAKLAAALVAGIVVPLYFLFGFVGDTVAGWFKAELSSQLGPINDTLSEVQQATQRNAVAIDQLRLPTDIFEVSNRSGPDTGFCISGQPCRMNVRVRRSSSALSCTLSDGMQWYYRNPRDNEVHDVSVLGGVARNVGTSWLNMPFTFSTPIGLSPDAELCVRPSYTGCPGQTSEDPPHSPEEECFAVPITDPS